MMETHKHTDTKAHNHTNTQTHKHTDTQTHKTHKHTDTQSDSHHNQSSVCLTTGLQSLRKQVLNPVRFNVSSFNC